RLSHSKVCMFIVQSQELLFSVIVPLSLRSQRSQMFFKVSAHVQNVRPFTIRRCSELQDSNLRPLGYEPSELPSCSTPRRCTSSTPVIGAAIALSTEASETRALPPTIPNHNVARLGVDDAGHTRAGEPAHWPMGQRLQRV